MDERKCPFSIQLKPCCRTSTSQDRIQHRREAVDPRRGRVVPGVPPLLRRSGNRRSQGATLSLHRGTLAPRMPQTSTGGAVCPQGRCAEVGVGDGRDRAADPRAMEASRAGGTTWEDEGARPLGNGASGNVTHVEEGDERGGREGGRQGARRAVSRSPMARRSSASRGRTGVRTVTSPAARGLAGGGCAEEPVEQAHDEKHVAEDQGELHVQSPARAWGPREQVRARRGRPTATRAGRVMDPGGTCRTSAQRRRDREQTPCQRRRPPAGSGARIAVTIAPSASYGSSASSLGEAAGVGLPQAARRGGESVTPIAGPEAQAGRAG